MTAVPLIAEHDTWISLDPIIGCPASCSYCYLQPLGLTSRKPQARVTPKELLDKLVQRFGKDGPRWGGPAKLPLPMCIGNYTDQMMHSDNIEFLTRYLELHATQFPEHPLCVVTKARLKRSSLVELDRVRHPVLVFLSQSFIMDDTEFRKLEIGPTSRSVETAENARLLSETENLIPLHFWRPLSNRIVPDLETAKRQLRKLQKAGVRASVAIGLKCGSTLRENAKRLKNLYEGIEIPESGEYLDPIVENRALRAGAELGHPVYRHTSCAIAFVLKQQEALGTWRYPMRETKCEPCSCIDSQRTLCDRARSSESAPPQGILSRIASDLNLPRNLVRWNAESGEIEIEATISQESQTKWTHISGHMVRASRIEQTLAWKGDFVNEEP